MASFMWLAVWQEDGIEAFDPQDPTNSYTMPVSVAEHCTKVEGAEAQLGLWWAWYSASGYLDCTEPCMGHTAREAAYACWDLHGDQESPEERSEMADVLWQIRKLERGSR